MSREGGGSDRGTAKRGIQDTTAGILGACRRDLEENVSAWRHMDKLGHIWGMSQAQVSG